MLNKAPRGAKDEMDPKAEYDRGEYPSIETLMPHRGPVLLLDRVIQHDSNVTTSLIRVDRQRFLTRDDGSVASWVSVEYLAQGVAAHEGLLAYYDGRPLPLGFLVAVNQLVLHEDAYKSDARLMVRALRVRGRPEMGALSHQCTLHLVGETFGEGRGDAFDEGALVAEGRISVSIPRPSVA